MVLNKRQRKKMFKLFFSGVNAKDKYLGDNICSGNIMHNLSRMEKLQKRLRNHRAVQRRWRMAVGLIRNPKAFRNAK